MNQLSCPPKEALARLRAGNQRFVNNVRSIESLAPQLGRQALVEGQKPFAVVLSCSDSRAPSELIFDCSLGDLFVVRVAGNVVAPSIVGSIEYAIESLGTQLVAVVGHTRCGAVAATIEALTQPDVPLSSNLRDIVGRISPAVTELVQRHPAAGPELLASAIRANVRTASNQLRHASRSLEERVAAGTVAIVGAEYSLETGIVDFFDVP
jgi:carbonic anhydrase